MNATQLALLAGGTIGLAIALFVVAMTPTQVDLRSALDQLSGEHAVQRFDAAAPTSARDRLGVWVMRHTTGSWWNLVPNHELRMLRVPPHRYYGEKCVFFILGLATPVVVNALLAIIGYQLPIAIPTIGSLALGVAFSFIPDYNVRSDALKAREEFTAALVAYIDLVALELRSGIGTRQALESAAMVGDSWVFRRLAEELGRSRWSGVPPWDGLLALSNELGIPELADLADVMRLAGEEGAAVAQSLAARAVSMRTAMSAREHAKANAIGERMSLPVSALAMVFLVLVATPPFLQILGAG